MKKMLVVVVMLAVAGSFGCASKKAGKKGTTSSSSTTTKKKKKTVAKKKAVTKKATTKKPAHTKYSDNVRAAFLNACTAESPERQCKCALRKLQKTVPAEELGSMDPAVRAKIMVDCLDVK